MSGIDQRIDAIARVQDNVIARGQVLAIGGSDKLVAVRLGRGLWQPLQAGVYLVGSAPPTWHQGLRGAVLAGGLGTEASCRAAILQWGLDGLASAPIEITMPYGNLAVPDLVVVHRSRRVEKPVYLGGIATSSVERALLEVGS